MKRYIFITGGIIAFFDFPFFLGILLFVYGLGVLFSDNKKNQNWFLKRFLTMLLLNLLYWYLPLEVFIALVRLWTG